ncbi:MAG: chromosomal replication initiator protein DnaA [Rhodospirillales bacterium]|nr:chromosomal replication initiator protein DnaA [Rhodospirillales bacterium]
MRTMAGMSSGTANISRVQDDLALQWDRVRTRLQSELGEAESRAWIRHAVPGALDGDEMALLLPSHFLRDWVRGQHGPRLTAAWQAENPAVRRVDVRVDARLAAGAAEAPPAPAPMPPATLAPAAARGAAELAPPLDPRFTFANFVVGKPNEFAYACARRVAERPASHGFNPLFLYGGVGLGKTHLMHAIAWDLPAREADGAAPAVAYMTAEQFMHRFIGAIRSHSTLEFKDQLRNVDVLMVDDLQFLVGKDSTQEEFFHTFNALVDAGKQIVVSADKSPSDLSIEGRLRTRLGCGMVADLHATNFELRMSILESKAALSRTEVPAKVLEFLAHKITASVRELEGALNRVIVHASLFDRPITLDGAQEVLADLLRAHDRRVTIDEIQRKVAEHYNIRLSDMASPRRARSVARPRQIAMYLAKHLTSRSLPEIGRKFGNRDHTTVLHAVGRVGELMARDVGLAEDIALLRRTLEG